MHNRINKVKTGSLKRLTKLSLLVRFIKGQIEKTQMISMRNKKEKTAPTDIKR